MYKKNYRVSSYYICHNTSNGKHLMKGKTMGKTEFYEISFGRYSNYYSEFEECGVMIVASSRYPGMEEIDNVLGMPWCDNDGIDIKCMGITPITKEEIIKHEHYYNQLIINLDTVVVVH